jgi:ribosome biogenesis protein Tsr3
LLVFWQPDDKKAVKKKRDCVFECQWAVVSKGFEDKK